MWFTWCMKKGTMMDLNIKAVWEMSWVSTTPVGRTAVGVTDGEILCRECWNSFVRGWFGKPNLNDEKAEWQPALHSPEEKHVCSTTLLNWLLCKNVESSFSSIHFVTPCSLPSMKIPGFALFFCTVKKHLRGVNIHTFGFQRKYQHSHYLCLNL